MAFLEDVRIVKLAHEVSQRATVLVVGNAAAVVTLSRQVGKGRVGDIVALRELVQENAQLKEREGVGCRE